MSKNEKSLKKIGELNIKMDTVQVVITLRRKQKLQLVATLDEQPGEENADPLKQMVQTNMS